MESELYVNNRDVVVPGMVLAKGMDYLPSKGTYRKDDKILANRLGLVQLDGKVLKTIPLAGGYLPKMDDVVIGKVTDVLLNGWRVEINSPYESVLTLKEASSEFIQRGADLTRYFALNDWIICKVVAVTSQNLIDVSVRGPGLRKLVGGRIIKVNTHKVPRIIGKRGSMVSMIKRATDCNVLVGQNGRVWINGQPDMEIVALDAIDMIEKNAHTSGLTERVKAFLEGKTGRTIEVTDDTDQFGDGDGEGGSQHRGPRREGGSGFRREGFRRREGFKRTNNDTSSQAPPGGNTDGGNNE